MDKDKENDELYAHVLGKGAKAEWEKMEKEGYAPSFILLAKGLSLACSNVNPTGVKKVLVVSQPDLFATLP